MNKFEKAQKILEELSADGWLIICNEDSDVNSRFLLGVESHALHYIYIATNGKHRIISVEMEAPMIERSLKNKGINAKIESYSSLQELSSKLRDLLDKKRIALNYGEDIFKQNGTSYADYLRVGDYFSVKELAPESEFFSAAPIIK